MCQGIISVSQSLIDGRLTVSQSKLLLHVRSKYYIEIKQITHFSKCNSAFTEKIVSAMKILQLKTKLQYGAAISRKFL